MSRRIECPKCGTMNQAGTVCECVGGSDQRLVRLEGIAAKALLRRWMTKYAPTCRPGGWDYDKDAAALCEETAELLETDVPW